MYEQKFTYDILFIFKVINYFSVPFKTTLEGRDCPFRKGTYSLTYSEKKGVENQCSDDATSTATVDGSTITMNACAGSDSYGIVYFVMQSYGICNHMVEGSTITIKASGDSKL